MLMPSSLANGLKNMTPTDKESDAINAFANAWEAYFMSASVSGIPISGSLSSAKSAMKSALTGMGSASAAATKLQSGIQAFWTAILPIGTSLWMTAPNIIVPPLVAPPTIGALSSALTGVFASNTSGKLSMGDCAQQIATALHAQGGVGGMAMLQPPGPVPPITMPIL